MGGLVREGKKALPVRMAALSIVGGNGQKDWVGEIRDIHAFVRDEIRYLRDIRGVETLHTPEKMLEIRQGDCDDKSILVCALLESIGHPTRLVAVGFRHGEFSHVYAETKIGDKWIGLETTEQVEVGWQPKNVTSRLIFFN